MCYACLPNGTGLPGPTWPREAAVFIDDVGAGVALHCQEADSMAPVP